MSILVTPKVRGFICTTSHPEGCAKNVLNQIEYINKLNDKLLSSNSKIKNVLVIGASQGFGLSARITAAFGLSASTIGVFFEKEATASKNRPASSGWYNSAEFEKQAKKSKLYAKSINGDAFSAEIKQQTIDLIKKDLGSIDLLIYSLASPRRTDPATGITYSSVLKPIGKEYTGKTVDVMDGKVFDINIEPASQDEILNTQKVMGGEDWHLWIDALQKENLLTNNFNTVAFSYIGPDLTYPIYRSGTIGKAKDNLEETAKILNTKLQEACNGRALISVNKCLVTQASSAIPVVPLYTAALYKVMKQKNIHEDTIGQMCRLFCNYLCTDNIDNSRLDSQTRIRLDDLEMREDVQQEVAQIMNKVTTENLHDLTDISGYREAFYQLFGFNLAGIDYTKETNLEVEIQSI